ncbi:dipeptidase [Acuticoccus yangtzensis]|uniref:dipeptidase n=1 Tax=Acuticoccus yangtzensis TaxID=1443441 RepID=UPI0009496444|nr:membrane dipeptidase [Acuticoccus yangtzensis]ORE95386.1 dipeptidase [Stappia sp. 22II-S9-Z10]
MDHTGPIIFDGHNDVLARLAAAGRSSAAETFASGPGHIDLARSRIGGFGGGFFAVWVASPGGGTIDFDAMSRPRYSVPLPPPVPQPDALEATMRQVSILTALQEAGAVRICRTAAAIEETLGTDQLAAVFHIEGAEAIDRDLTVLDVLYEAGLRSLGPVWSRPNRFGHGVPFRFPSSPDTGPGLTEDGLRLVDRCLALGIMVDVSHLTEAGFWDIAKRTTKPIVATHSNAHVLTAAARNLTDKQLAAIAETGGVVGLNFASAFLREDGKMDGDVPLPVMLRHIDHLLGILGEDGVALGSDYDGALVPREVDGVQRLPALRKAMRAAGYDEPLIAKLCHRNWVNLLRRTWGE